ncbi:unnamed protein product, partial [Didymodactylos carnosus]
MTQLSSLRLAIKLPAIDNAFEQVTDILANDLKVNNTLIQLHLGGNEISERGGKALAEALKVNNTLTKLGLQGNQISDRGLDALSEALKVNNTLTQLDLGGNQIRGGEALGEALK